MDNLTDAANNMGDPLDATPAAAEPLMASDTVTSAEAEGSPVGSKKCLNCEAVLTGPFCGACGQKDLPRRQTLGDLLVNFLGSFTSFESKFFTTFRFLLFRPGRIVKEYNEGKRERFYHPARMYVFLSFIYFLIFSLVFSSNTERMITTTTTDRDRVAVAKETPAIDIQTTDPAKKNKFSPKTRAQYDSLQATLPEEERDNWFGRYMTHKGMELMNKFKNDDRAINRAFLEIFLTNLPKMVFLLMPLFALLLKLLYIRKDFFYSEHLIFTVFFYDFLYLVGSIMLLVNLVDWLEWLDLVALVWLLIYLYKSMRQVYGQSRAKTVIKFLILAFAFSVVLVVALAGVAVYTFTQL
ncbi:MAG: DUF3667 domain-containing protein [Cyclobacteriaceae bacterium]|jgi:hypothetical protein|nr:DUF3667 domain-containing protein [Cyclobacteriaceae bacterium]